MRRNNSSQPHSRTASQRSTHASVHSSAPNNATENLQAKHRTKPISSQLRVPGFPVSGSSPTTVCDAPRFREGLKGGAPDD